MDYSRFHACKAIPNFLEVQEAESKNLGTPDDGFDASERRLDLLIEGARVSGFTVDALDYLSRGLSESALRMFIGNASSMPSYMKSSVGPYLLRSARAPSTDMR